MEDREGFCSAVFLARSWTSLKSWRVEDVCFLFNEAEGDKVRCVNDRSVFGMDSFSSCFFCGFFRIGFIDEEEFVRSGTECLVVWMILEVVVLSF